VATDGLRKWEVAVGPLSESSQQEVLALAATAEQVDGVAPLSEAPLLNLTHSAPWLTHVIVHANNTVYANNPMHPNNPRKQFNPDTSYSPAETGSIASGTVVGYAQIARSGAVASAELVVHPQLRSHGIGGMLLAIAEADARLPATAGGGLSSGQDLRVWAHGDLPAAQQFAAAKGYQPVRELLRLSRKVNNHHPLTSDTALQRVDLPAGYQLRTYRVGDDDAAWLAANRVIFADHPEQGRLTLADLTTRQQLPWFNPADFYLVTTDDDDDIVAFCWIKVEVASDTGEIYAIGVHPEHRRRGLAAALLRAVSVHLIQSGLSGTTLYVEGDNEPALAAYYAAGFSPLSADVQYAKAKTLINE